MNWIGRMKGKAGLFWVLFSSLLLVWQCELEPDDASDDGRIGKYYGSGAAGFKGDAVVPDLYYIGKDEDVRTMVFGKPETDARFFRPNFKQVFLVNTQYAVKNVAGDDIVIYDYDIFGVGTGNTPVLFRYNFQNSGKVDYVTISVPNALLPEFGGKQPKRLNPGYYNSGTNMLISGAIAPDDSVYLLARAYVNGLKIGINEAAGAKYLKTADGKNFKAKNFVMRNRQGPLQNEQGWLLASTLSDFYVLKLFRCTGVDCTLWTDVETPSGFKAFALEDLGSDAKGVAINIVDAGSALIRINIDGNKNRTWKNLAPSVFPVIDVRRNLTTNTLHSLYMDADRKMQDIVENLD